jgi:hypothetical protein
MPRDYDPLLAASTQLLFMWMGQRLGLNAAYHAFGRAAELEDRSELLQAAGWQVLGKTIVVALSSRSTMGDIRILFADTDDQHTRDASERITWPKDLFISVPDVGARARRIANNLGVLLDAGRKGGNISADSVYDIARTLELEITTLLHTLDKFAPSVLAAAN